MHSVVRRFRSVIVEGRFIPVLTSICVIGMRAAMFYWGNRAQASFIDDSHLWRYFEHLFDDPFTSFFVSTLSVFLIASIIATMNGRFNLIRSRSNLPLLFLFFLLSLHPCFLVMNGNYIAIVFVLLAFFSSTEILSKVKFIPLFLSCRGGVNSCSFIVPDLRAYADTSMVERGTDNARPSVPFALVIAFRCFTNISICFFLSIFFSMIFPVSFSLFLAFALFSLPGYSSFFRFGVGGCDYYRPVFVSNMIFSINTYSRDKVLTISFMQFVVFLTVFMLLLQIVYWSRNIFFLTLVVPLISYLNAYFYTRTVSKSAIYMAYFIIVVMTCFYLSHFSFFC